MLDQPWESKYRFALPAETAEAGEVEAGETTPAGQEPIKWVSVAAALGPAQAEILRGRLETEGIPARVAQEAAGGVYGLTVGLLGQVDVIVPEEQAARAREVLSDVAEEAPQEEDKEDEG